MEDNIFSKFRELHKKSMELYAKYNHLSEKDIKRTHLGALSSQIAVSALTLDICYEYCKNHCEEFSKHFNDDTKLIDNYIHNLIQSNVESVLDSVLFQTELILRILYSKLTNGNPSEEKNINKIISKLYEDTENNWKKDEAKIMVLFWTIRNMIHTGGIYFKKIEGHEVEYKGRTYKFEHQKSMEFLSEKFHLFDLLFDVFDSLDYLFDSEMIKNIGFVEHPSFKALEK